MATKIVPLDRGHLPAVRRFSERVWERPRSDAYYRWRYEAADFHRAWLALREEECLAMEAAIRRPYRVGHETIDVLEVFDWYALPELRNAGVGVRVMQLLMKEPHPLMLVGGTEDTQTILPRLEWKRVGTSTRWVLALGAERTRAALERRLGLPTRLADLAAQAAVRRPGARPRPRAVPDGGRVVSTASVGEAVEALYSGALDYGTLPLWSRELLDWLFGFPGLGHFVPLLFGVRGRLVGWSLVRVYPTPGGCDAEIIELMAPRPDPGLYTWMISETATRAAAFAPGIVAGRTTCPAAEEGFRRNRFRATSSDPVNFWLQGRAAPPDPILIGSNTNDAAISPLIDGWWNAEAAGGAR